MAGEPGVLPTPPQTYGQEQYGLVLHQAGQQAADQYKAEESDRMAKSGVSPNAIAGYWGDKIASDDDADKTIATNLARNGPLAAPKMASNPWEAFMAGWDTSDGGLILRGKMPDLAVPKNAPLMNKVLQGVGQFAGDVPFAAGGFVAGGTAGGAAGAALPGANLTGVSEAGGAVVGAGFGAAATPQALREALMIAYQRGTYKNSSEFRDAVIRGTLNTLKAGAVGAVANLAGGAVGGKVLEASGSEILGQAANDATQVVTGATAGAALDGHLPEPSDFITASVGALGAHAGRIVAGKFQASDAGRRVQSNLQKVYSSTGITPWEAVQLAKSNPNLMQELTAQDVHGDPVTPTLNVEGKIEPGHYGDPETGSPQWASKRIELASTGVDRLSAIVKGDEHSAPDAVSPKGAIGTYQIMPGTARQYGYDPARLTDPAYNEQAHRAILTHLNLKYNGDEAAVLAAYNAGPGRANELMRAGPGTRLEAERDPTSPGGWKYTQVPAGRDESFLPLETQRYIARGRLLAGEQGAPATSAPEAGEGPVAAPKGLNEPEWAKADTQEEEQPAAKDAETIAREQDQRAQEEQSRQEQWEAINTEFQRRLAKNADESTALAAAIAKAPPSTGDINDAYETLGSKILDADAGSTSKMPLGKQLGNMVSELNPAMEIDRTLAQYGFDPKKDLGVEDVFRLTKGSFNKAAGIMKFGPIDPRTGEYDTNGPSIQKAFDMVAKAGGNKEDWERYMVAQRAMKMEGRGMKSGFDMGAAARVTSDPGEIAKYEEATRHFNEALDAGILAYAQSRGLYSQAQRDAMNAENPTYLMFNRAQEVAEGLARAKGLNPQQVKKLTGSDRPIISPINGTLMNAMNIIANADRNAAHGALVSLAERKILPEGYGVEKTDEEAPATSAEQIIQASLDGEKNDTTFKYYRDGRAETWTTQDPDLAKLLQAIPAGENNPVVKLINNFSGLERAGVMGDPSFPLRMMLRHQSMAYIMDPHNVTPYVRWIGGIVDAFGQGPGYRRLLASGGMGAAIADLDVDSLHGSLNDVLDQTGYWDKAMNVVGRPQDYLSNLVKGMRFVQERLDAGARIGYQNALAAKGIDLDKSGALSRKIFIDYAERSTSPLLNTAYSMAPFLKTHMIGNKALLDAFTANPVGASAKIAASIALPVAAMYAVNYIQDQGLPEDRKFSQLPRWEKDTQLITPEIAGQRIKIPLPPVIGPAVGGLIWRSLDAIMREDPDAFHGWAQSFLKQLVPDATPTIIKPWLEQVTNYNFWTGKPLVPASMTDRTPDMQFTKATTEPAKALSRVLGSNGGMGLINMSPIAMENYVSSWGGTLGTAALQALNAPFKQPGPPSELADNVFVKGFLARHPGANAQAIQDFYDEEQRFTAAHADYAAAKQELTSGQMGDFNNMIGNNASFVKVANFNKALKAQQRVIDTIDQNKDMTVDEKRQNIEQTYISMIETAKAGTSLMREIP